MKELIEAIKKILGGGQSVPDAKPEPTSDWPPLPGSIAPPPS